MKVCSIPKASEEIKALIDLAASGEEIILTEADVPVVRMVSAAKKDIRKHPANGSDLATIFDRLAALGGIEIDDPCAWQRDVRKDRPLTGRE